ncbi:hypothetical protein Pla52o_57990 [Novipirellula galeiformis]|uniref:DNA mimic protein DMP19 C-terminal domain-containing protein n=1 Tax=Novipirellula galeiformis TaxID=2528004 RepID=A0A5C6BE80_9BACT|nr:DUF4375 domain-containing protein [Novipirellula galeiformis]TWU10042.1 hypothetical protein Pla52o_57990 [Novipirellula galeiformis]
MLDYYEQLEPYSVTAESKLAEFGGEDTDVRLLAEPYRTVAIVFAAQGVIDNGGLTYFFEADFPTSPPYSLFSDAYRRIGMRAAADAIDDAAASFGLDRPEADARFRREFMNSQFGTEEGESKLDIQWNDCICGDKSVWKSLYTWVMANGG